MPVDFNCEYCYCPEYFDTKCSGFPKWVKAWDSKTTIKDCTDCTINHTMEYIKRYGKNNK